MLIYYLPNSLEVFSNVLAVLAAILENPASFQIALQRMNLTPSEAIVVENSPLGIEAANNAGIPYILTLNNTPLEMSDFGSLLEDKLNNRIFKDTKTAGNFLKDWCCK